MLTVQGYLAKLVPVHIMRCVRWLALTQRKRAASKCRVIFYARRIVVICVGGLMHGISRSVLASRVRVPETRDIPKQIPPPRRMPRGCIVRGNVTIRKEAR